MIQDRLEREIKLIENDESLTDEEKNKEIRELERESADRAYDDEYNRW